MSSGWSRSNISATDTLAWMGRLKNIGSRNNYVLPIKAKATVVEILDLEDHPEDMLVLVEKEANEDPKLIMIQKSEYWF